MQLGAEPLFITSVSKESDYMAAAAEIAAEAKYQCRSRDVKEWDFGIVFVRGYDSPKAVTDVAKALGSHLGLHGKIIGVAMDGVSGCATDGNRMQCGLKDGPSLMFMGAQIPRGNAAAPVPASGLAEAKPFFVGKDELMDISKVVMRLQARTRVRGAKEGANPRAWREYLGVEGCEPKGILLFVDPLASRYVVTQTLAGLDLAFPNAVKFGGACADLDPEMARISAPKGGDHYAACGAGVAGLILPSCVSVHSVVTPTSITVGPELRLTRAQGQVVSEINDMPAAEALAAIGKEAAPLERLLIERTGFLIGIEAPKDIDHTRSKVYDDDWGSSAQPLSYAKLAQQAVGGDWLVRSVEPYADGSIVIRREDLKRVPRRVGQKWLRCQLHVQDPVHAREELKLMLQRYLGARMMLTRPARPMGALLCSCTSTGGKGEEEMGLADLHEAFGEKLPIAGLATHGEIAPIGIAIGGSDEKRTTRQGHTASVCLFCYDPQ